MNRLEGKVAIVTGAADGIGLCISQSFVKEGASVVMCDINIEKCDKEAAALKNECSILKQLINTTIDKFGKIDILVNNAAVAIEGDIREMPESDWDTLMNTNLKSVFRGQFKL